MKIRVDYDLCEANAICMQQNPKVFRVDDEDNLHILIEEIGEEHRESVEAAVRLCPRQALRLEGSSQDEAPPQAARSGARSKP